MKKDQNKDNAMTHYLMVHFVDGAPNGEAKDQEQIYFSVSDDGNEWKMLNNMEPVLRSEVGELGVRDPHIIRSADGKRFYLIATDLSIVRNPGWGRAQKEGSKSIMIWESEDLVNWSKQRMAEVAPESAGCAWAPESVYDEERGQYMVFWSSNEERYNYDYHRVYRAFTTDFVTFTKPEVWIDNGVSTIDLSVKKIGNRYYRMSKNAEKSVLFEVSATTDEVKYPLDGEWKLIEGDSIMNITQQGHWEGALFYKVNGTENTWRTMVDHFGGWTEEFPESARGLTQFETDDIAMADFVSVNDKLKLPSYNERTGAVNGNGRVPYKHGTVLPISDIEYNALVEKYKISAAPSESERSGQDEMAAYLFVHFVGTERTEMDEQVYFSVSKDAMEWEAVNDGKPVLVSTLGERGSRDTFIVRAPEGDKFFLIATDLSMYRNHKTPEGRNDWEHANTYGSQYINVWESTDLVNWSEQRQVHVTVPDAGMAWAPECIYDVDKKAYLVFWASKTTVNDVRRERIYCSYTVDFKTFTEPEIYMERDRNIIDTTIYYENGIYYRFYKYGPDVRSEYATSLHPESWTDTGLLLKGCEGPEVFKFNGENKWGIVVDADNYSLWTTDDLDASELTKENMTTETIYRHGSLIPITQKEYDALKAMKK